MAPRVFFCWKITGYVYLSFALCVFMVNLRDVRVIYPLVFLYIIAENNKAECWIVMVRYLDYLARKISMSRSRVHVLTTEHVSWPRGNKRPSM